MQELKMYISRLKSAKNVFKGDRVIWSIFLLLCLVSIVEVYSSSAVLGFKTGHYEKAALFQASMLGLGTLAMIVVANIPCRYFKALAPVAMLGSTLLLILVFFVGVKTNDAARWIDLGFVQLQPSELAKGTMVLMTAKILSSLQTFEGAVKKAFWSILKTGVFLILPIIPENFSTGFILSAVVFFMMFVGRVPLSQLGKLCSAVIIGATIIAFMIFAVGEDEKATAANPELHYTEVTKGTPPTQDKGILHKVFHRINLWHKRMTDFFNKEEVEANKYDLQKNSQVGCAHIAIANGHFFGVGPGNSDMRNFLPLAFSDFIFAIIIEELGLVGGFCVALLYLFLLFRTGIIANQCKNPFPAYLAIGLAMLIVLQAFFNMGVAVGLFPVTGQPLPLISKGGTSTIINCVYIGIILSVSRTAEKKSIITK